MPLVRGALLFSALTRGPLRWPALAEQFQKALKKRRIEKRRPVPLTFERTLRWEGAELRIVDQMVKLRGCPALRAVGPVDDVDVHSPSSRLGGRVRSSCPPIGDARSREWGSRLSQEGRLRIETIYGLDEEGSLSLLSLKRT